MGELVCFALEAFITCCGPEIFGAKIVFDYLFDKNSLVFGKQIYLDGKPTQCEMVKLLDSDQLWCYLMNSKFLPFYHYSQCIDLLCMVRRWPCSLYFLTLLF
jgi:hypothetical protein